MLVLSLAFSGGAGLVSEEGRMDDLIVVSFTKAVFFQELSSASQARCS